MSNERIYLKIEQINKALRVLSIDIDKINKNLSLTQKELEQWKDDYYKLKDKYEPEIAY